AANYTERRIDGQLQRVNDLVLGHLKQRMIAEEHPQNDPGSCRSQHNRAENGRMQVSRNLFKRKHNGGQWRVEGGGDRCSSTDGKQGFDTFRAEAELPAEDRSDPGAHLYGRAFAPERNSASERRRGAEEFSKNGANGDPAAPCEKRRFRLWNPASPRVRKI